MDLLGETRGNGREIILTFVSHQKNNIFGVLIGTMKLLCFQLGKPYKNFDFLPILDFKLCSLSGHAMCMILLYNTSKTKVRHLFLIIG